MSRLGSIAEVFRYPVKSMLGESLEAVELDELGVVGDRTWAVRDETRGDFSTGKRVAALMGCRGRAAKGDDGVPEIELPDGGLFRADDENAGERLSQALGRKVTIWPVGSKPAPVEPRGEARDPEAEMREIMARQPDEPLPDFSQMPSELLGYLGRPDRPFVDLSPLLVLSRQSLDTLARAAIESKIDVRRFRPSLLVDAPEGGEFPELAWVGRRLEVGEAELAISMACPRCVMTTHGFADLPEDPLVMRRLVSRAEGNLGVYATVERAGRVAVGDAIESLG